MDWTALLLSLRLAGWTVVLLLPVAVIFGRLLAYQNFRGKGLCEALVMLPLVLPPTVFGYYLLVVLGRGAPIGDLWQQTFGQPLVFSFEGLVLASVIFNLPFAIPACAARVRGRSSRCQRGRRLLRDVPMAQPDAGRATFGMAWFDDGDGPDLCPYAGRVRDRADGRRVYPGGDPHHRDCDLRPCAGV